MKTLILMRHAKSDWAKPGQRDNERPLNSSGLLEASQMGFWLRGSGHIPQVAIISSAKRTRETWDQMGMDCDAQFEDALYLAGAEDYLSAVQSAADCDCLLVLGHNPGMETAMGEFAGRRMSATTATTAVYSLPIRQWRDAKYKHGSLEAFESPRTLV